MLLSTSPLSTPAVPPRCLPWNSDKRRGTGSSPNLPATSLRALACGRRSHTYAVQRIHRQAHVLTMDD